MRLGRGLPTFGDRSHCYKNDQRVFCTCWSFSAAAPQRLWARNSPTGNTRSSCKQRTEHPAVQAAPVVCPEERPLLVTLYTSLAGSSPQPRLRRRSADSTLWSAVLLRQTARRGAGAGGKSPACSCCKRNHRREAGAPTTARTVGLPTRRGKYFLSMRKKVPKKACGTATTGKRLLLPILPAGLAMSRAMKLDSFHKLLERARARLFPPSKWAGLFPSAAYRRSAPPQLACGRLKWRYLGCFGVAWLTSQR